MKLPASDQGEGWGRGGGGVNGGCFRGKRVNISFHLSKIKRAQLCIQKEKELNCMNFSIGNHMISSAFWNKYARVNFFKVDQNL